MVRSAVKENQEPDCVLYLWSLIDPRQQWVSKDFGFSLLHTAADKLLVNRFLYKHPGSSQTALTLVKEQAAVGLLHCILYCKTHMDIWSKMQQLHC